MTLYFDFEDQRRTADVIWPENDGSIQVTLADRELIRKLPSDLIFDLNKRNKISYLVENPDHKRLIQLQKIVSKRLQEFANQL